MIDWVGVGAFVLIAASVTIVWLWPEDVMEEPVVDIDKHFVACDENETLIMFEVDYRVNRVTKIGCGKPGVIGWRVVRE